MVTRSVESLVSGISGVHSFNIREDRVSTASDGSVPDHLTQLRLYLVGNADCPGMDVPAIAVCG